MNKQQTASLGCGSLILITLIILIFGNMGGKDAAEQVRGLRSDVQKLQKTVEAQTLRIESLEQVVSEKLGPAEATTQPTGDS